MVILFFMHVKYSSRLTKLICGTAFFFLAILFGLTLSDYLPPPEPAERPAETPAAP